MQSGDSNGIYYLVLRKRGELSQGIYFKDREEMKIRLSQIKNHDLNMYNPIYISPIQQTQAIDSIPNMNCQSEDDQLELCQYDTLSYNNDSYDYYSEYYVGVEEVF